MLCLTALALQSDGDRMSTRATPNADDARRDDSAARDRTTVGMDRESAYASSYVSAGRMTVARVGIAADHARSGVDHRTALNVGIDNNEILRID